jgi:hypothetical protein
VGQENPFPPLKLSDRCRSEKPTFAGAHGNGRYAPITAIGPGSVELVKPTL